MAHFQIVTSTVIAGQALYRSNYDKPTFFCGGATKQSMLELSLTCFLLIAIEAVILLLFFYVYYLNLKKRYISLLIFGVD